MASSLEAWLIRNGFDDLFIDHASIRSGDKWMDALRRAKGACRVVLCVVTPEWLASDECFGEFMAGWYAGRRMIPLLAVTGAHLDDKQQDRLRRVLGEDQAVDIAAAGAPAALDLDAFPAIADPLKAGLRASGALARVGLDPYAFEIDREIRSEPFPGLESFGDTDADAAIFFGRSAEISQCLEDLREMRATGDRRAYAIQGASGSGKSSLMKAGVLPRLRRERGWLVLRSFRPGADPLLSFATAITQTAEDLKENISPGTIRSNLHGAWRAAAAEKGRATEAAYLARLRAALDEATAILRERADRPGATILIAMDQGEELARAEGDSGDALGDFLKAALFVAAQGDEPVPFMVAFTVRTDSFQELQAANRFRGIATRPADIRSIPVFRFGNAIEQPAARYGVEFEPKLVDTLMEDASGNDALPLLAFTLQRLWHRFSVERIIRESNYADVGKLSGLIEDAAERALRGIDPLGPQGPLEGEITRGSAQDTAAMHAFVPALAQVNERGAAIRRVARLESFTADERALLMHFVKWRLVVTSGDTVEVAHESMFREWPRFRAWLAPERARLETLRGVESAAVAWNTKGQKTDDLLHRDRRLREARALESVADYKRQLDGNVGARAYLAACVDAEHRRRIHNGAILLALSMPFIIYGVYLAVANIELYLSKKAAENRTPTSHILAPGEKPKDGAVFRDCDYCPEMKVIPANTFTMGTPDNDSKHRQTPSPEHSVTISRFAIGRFDVTFAEWDVCVHDRRCAVVSDEGWGRGNSRGNRPVINVSWNDAQDFATWLAGKTGKPYRLLSESEFEDAARAGTKTPYYTGNSIDNFQANFNHRYPYTLPVGSFPPNPWGLYDMAGNVWSWVQDCWHDNYRVGAPRDSSAWMTGQLVETECFRAGSAPGESPSSVRCSSCQNGVVRGGAWGSDPTDLRSANRIIYNPQINNVIYIGFRIARNLD